MMKTTIPNSTGMTVTRGRVRFYMPPTNGPVYVVVTHIDDRPVVAPRSYRVMPDGGLVERTRPIDRTRYA